MDVSSQNERGLRYEPEVDYHRAWKAYSRRHHAAIFLVFTWPVVALGLFALSRFWIHQPVVCLTIIVLWLVLALAAVWWSGEFRCPRCRRRYAALGHKKGSTNVTRGLFDQVCSNCKLRKFEHGERRVQGSSRAAPANAFAHTEQRAPGTEAHAVDVTAAPIGPTAAEPAIAADEPALESGLTPGAPSPEMEPVDVAPGPIEPAFPAPATADEPLQEPAAVATPVVAVGVKLKNTAKRKPRQVKR